MAAEVREFKMHQKLLQDVIMRQAGSLEKAVLEGVMNSIEAGADRIDIEVKPSYVEIRDNGKGFKSEANIKKWFEWFGQPHEAEEGKVWAEFRMGRGQLFSFGQNEWRTGPFRMKVDIKAHLGYELDKDLDNYKGCEIIVYLYRHLSEGEVNWTVREIKKHIRFVDIPVRVNGVQVNQPPAEYKTWDRKLTDDTAYIDLSRGNELEVYNRGVFVRTYHQTKFGVTGIVVSKPTMKVNFARNDIQSDCKVWAEIKKKLGGADMLEFLLKKKSLTKEERYNLLERYAAGECVADKLSGVSIFTDVTGHTHRPRDLRNWALWSLAEKYDHIADSMIQTKRALVLDQAELQPFVDSSGNVIDSVRAIVSASEDWNRQGAVPDFIPFEDLKKKWDHKNSIVREQEWTAQEWVWVDVLGSMKCYLAMMYGSAHGHNAGNNFQRSIVVGVSSSAVAWTDGVDWIAFDRRYLERFPLLNSNKKIAWRSIGEMLHTLCHELAHNGDSLKQGHSPEFYRIHHDLTEGMHKAMEWVGNNLPPEKVLAWLEQRKKRVEVEKRKDERRQRSAPAPAAARVKTPKKPKEKGGQKEDPLAW